MRFAMLVLGYREPAVLRRALPLYTAAGFDVYLHLDQKVDRDIYVKQLGEAATQCRIIETRFNVFWAGFSMVQAELALIAAARAAKVYDRYTLVSDDTFPIATGDQLRAAINEDLDRIMLRKLDKNDPFYKRYRDFFYFDHPGTSAQGRAVESAAIDDEFLDEMLRLRQMKLFGKSDIDVYYGSQWWTITESSMETLFKEMERDQQLMLSFKYSAVPDEFLFQTLIGKLIDLSHVRQSVVYVDWSREVRPFVFRKLDELPSVTSDYLFLRKVSAHGVEIMDYVTERFFDKSDAPLLMARNRTPTAP
jgi:hypothetical protein